MNKLQTYALCSALRTTRQPAKITDDAKWLERRAAAIEIRAQSLDAKEPPIQRVQPAPPHPSQARKILSEINARHDAILSRAPQ